MRAVLLTLCLSILPFSYLYAEGDDPYAGWELTVEPAWRNLTVTGNPLLYRSHFDDDSANDEGLLDQMYLKSFSFVLPQENGQSDAFNLSFEDAGDKESKYVIATLRAKGIEADVSHAIRNTFFDDDSIAFGQHGRETERSTTDVELSYSPSGPIQLSMAAQLSHLKGDFQRTIRRPGDVFSLDSNLEQDEEAISLGGTLTKGPLGFNANLSHQNYKKGEVIGLRPGGEEGADQDDLATLNSYEEFDNEDVGVTSADFSGLYLADRFHVTAEYGYSLAEGDSHRNGKLEEAQFGGSLIEEIPVIDQHAEHSHHRGKILGQWRILKSAKVRLAFKKSNQSYELNSKEEQTIIIAAVENPFVLEIPSHRKTDYDKSIGEAVVEWDPKGPLSFLVGGGLHEGDVSRNWDDDGEKLIESKEWSGQNYRLGAKFARGGVEAGVEHQASTQEGNFTTTSLSESSETSLSLKVTKNRLTLSGRAFRSHGRNTEELLDLDPAFDTKREALSLDGRYRWDRGSAKIGFRYSDHSSEYPVVDREDGELFSRFEEHGYVSRSANLATSYLLKPDVEWNFYARGRRVSGSRTFTSSHLRSSVTFPFGNGHNMTVGAFLKRYSEEEAEDRDYNAYGIEFRSALDILSLIGRR